LQRAGGASTGGPAERLFRPQVERLVAERHLGRVYVDGDMDPSEVMSSVLLRHGLDVFWLDDYRTPEFAAAAAGDPPSFYLTMADDTDSARFLRQEFGAQQTMAFPLPGEGITIRGYVLQPADVQGALDKLLTEKLDLQAANGLVLTSFHADGRLSAGQPLQAALSWTWPGGTRPAQRYTAFAHLVDASGKEIARSDNPVQPTQDWAPGQTVVQWFDLQVPAGTPPGRYSLDLGFYGNNIERQQLTNRSGHVVGGSLTLGPFVVPPPAAASPLAPAEAQLGDGIELLSHQASASAGKLDLTLTWGATARPSEDYTVFVHVLDASGKVVAQSDSQPRGGDFPTSVWLPGDAITDRYSLALPPGRYTVEVGMYYLPTLERLGGGPVTFGAEGG